MRTKQELSNFLEANGIELKTFNIAQGGSAVVHRAHVKQRNESLGLDEGTEIAIKEYKPEAVARHDQMDRIRQEVMVGRNISHTNVVPIHGLLESEAGSPLLVMAWIDGVTFFQWRQQLDSAPSWDDLRKIFSGLADGIAALHAGNVMHRDIKPENIFVTQDCIPVLADMGVVEVVGDDACTLHTLVKDFVGSVRYASPQFIRGETFEAADDVYSLMGTLFYAVTGTEPFSQVARKSLLPHIVLTERQKVGEVAPELPPQIAVLVEGGLHPERSRRPTLAEVRVFFESADGASYIQRELDARNREQRGFQVIQVLDKGATVLADLRGADPGGGRYVVVRELQHVRVPSLGGTASPEKWIADIELRHIHNGIGHFSVLGKRWETGKRRASSILAEFMDEAGQWVEYDKLVESVRVGDVIVRPTA